MGRFCDYGYAMIKTTGRLGPARPAGVLAAATLTATGIFICQEMYGVGQNVDGSWCRYAKN